MNLTCSPRWRCAYRGYGFPAVCGAVARVRRLRRDPGFPGPVPEGGRLGSPDRRVKRRLRESVQGFRSLLFRRKCLNVVGERVKGEKTVSPFTIPAAPQRNRCCALRSPPGPQPAVGSTRPYSSHPWDSPLRGQRKRCSKLLPAILSGQIPRRLVICPTGCRQLSNPRSGLLTPPAG